MKRFKEIHVGYPAHLKSDLIWNKYLDKMIIAFEIIIKLDCSDGTKKEQKENGKRGRFMEIDIFFYFYFVWNQFFDSY